MTGGSLSHDISNLLELLFSANKTGGDNESLVLVLLRNLERWYELRGD